MENKIILIDGNSLMFRAYYATAYPGATLMQTSKGEYTNAIFAFVNMFQKIVTDNQTNAIVLFDTGKPTFRHLEYQEYKAGRSEMPDELREQIPRVYEYINFLGIKTYAKDGYEADDLIGILATEAKTKGMKVEIYSSDRDLLQLVNDDVTVNLLKSGMKEVRSYTPETLFEEFELTHDQIIDLKALQGDSSDNIPGVPGIGPKTATKLLKEYQTIENIYDNLGDLKGKMKENLEVNKDLAILSKRMVTILTEGDLDENLDSLKRSKYDEMELVNFLQKYELHSLVKQMDVKTVDPNWEYKVIADEASLKTILKDNSSIHIELSDENYHLASIYGIGYFDGKNSYFIEKELLETNTFKDYLKGSLNKYTYNYKAVKVNLLWQDITFNNVNFDLLLAAYLIDSHIGRQEFKYIVANFNYDDVEYDELIYGKGSKKGLPEDKSLYQKHIVSKARAIHLLKDDLIERLEKDNQLELFESMELPLSKVLAKMEYAGIKVDKDELKTQQVAMKERIDNLSVEIIELAGRDFNIASPKQLGEVLFEDLALPYGKKNKTGYSTNADVLDKLKGIHPIIPLIIEYRELSKLYSTYLVGLESTIFEDGKIHTIYQQALTTTGRLSSVDPNLQNIPTRTNEGRQIRKVFIASDNHYLLASDYSQIELRILADIADVKGLIDAFNNDQDIHSETASKVFNTIDVSSEQRRAAKAVNFGIIYGIGSWSLADDLGVSNDEAKQFIENYLNAYPEIKEYMDNIVKFAYENGYVETISKRRRYIPELKSNVFFQKKFGERTALNAPIQGTAADIIKFAMIELDKYLEANNKQTKMLLQVHDELIFEVPEFELDEMKEVIPKIMNNAFKLRVALEVQADHGKTWYEI